MSALFEPLSLRGVTFPNRIAVSPMCQYMALEGCASEWHLVHYGGLAQGGAGLVLLEATAVRPEGRISPADLGLWEDEQTAGLAQVAAFVAGQGSVPGIQLAHAGRKASVAPPWEGRNGTLGAAEGGWPVIGPSPIPFDTGYAEPAAMTEEDLADLVQAFARATGRAAEAGFQVVEIHAAHGYLLHQFLSPLSNQRMDGYGGDFEGRTRLLREVVAAVRECWPEELPLLVRLSATDWADGACWDVDQSIRLARLLGEMGVDLVDVSSGGMLPAAAIPVRPDYQVPFAARIRAEAEIPTAAVGLITEAAQAEAIVAHGQADLVLLGRELLRHPRWPLAAASQLGAQVPWPLPYARAAR